MTNRSAVSGPRIPLMTGVRGATALGALFAAGVLLSGCNTGTSPGALPVPDFQVPLSTPFALRAGQLAYVQGASNYLYLSVQSIGLDDRCPPEATCDEPGFLQVIMEFETSESQGAGGLLIPANGEAVVTFQGFEIRTHEVQPPRGATRIPLIDYAFLLTVSERN